MTPTECTFNEAVEMLSNLPNTWYGPLLRTMVEAAYKKEVFIKGGASYLVSVVETEMGRDKRELKP
jgi:hypothetical protein